MEMQVMLHFFAYPEVVLQRVVEAWDAARTDACGKVNAINRLRQLKDLPLSQPLPPLSKERKIPGAQTLVREFNDFLTTPYDDSSSLGLLGLVVELAGFVRDVQKGESNIRYIFISDPYGMGKTEIVSTPYEKLRLLLGEDALYKHQAVVESSGE